MTDNDPTIEESRENAWNSIQYNRDTELADILYVLNEEISVEERMYNFTGQILSYPYRGDNKKTVFEERIDLGRLVDTICQTNNPDLVSDINNILEKSDIDGVHGSCVTRFRKIGQYLADKGIDTNSIFLSLGIRHEDILDQDVDLVTPVVLSRSDEEQ